jgi:transcription elongation factor
MQGEWGHRGKYEAFGGMNQRKSKKTGLKCEWALDTSGERETWDGKVKRNCK